MAWLLSTHVFNVPSLSSGCEIAQFFVRYMVNRTSAFHRCSSFQNLRLGWVQLLFLTCVCSIVHIMWFDAVIYDHRVISTDTSRWYVFILWFRPMICSSCDFDRHIAMICSSCDFDRRIVSYTSPWHAHLVTIALVQKRMRNVLFDPENPSFGEHKLVTRLPDFHKRW